MKDWAWGCQWGHEGRGGYGEPHRGGSSSLQGLSRRRGWGEGGAQDELGVRLGGQPAGWAWESVKRGGLPWWLSNKQHTSQHSRRGSTPGLGKYPGEGNGNPRQYSCLKNPMDRGACQATVHGNSNSRRAEHDLATKVKWMLLSSVRLLVTAWTIVHGIFQARTLEWVAFPFSSGSSQPRDQTLVSCIAGRFFTSSAARETLVTKQQTDKERHLGGPLSYGLIEFVEMAEC